MSGMISQEDLKEFRQEGSELLEAAEKALLSLEDGADYKTQYNALFRAFHNLKGAAGMMEMLDLQAHTHVLETELVSKKESDSLDSAQIDYFLKGVDKAKKLLIGNSDISEPIEEKVIPLKPNVTPIPTPTQMPAPVQNIEPKHDKPVLEKKSLIVEVKKFLLFSEGSELDALESHLKLYHFEVTNCRDYIEGITQYDSIQPQVIIVSPEFKQTTSSELRSILHKDGHDQLFIHFDFTSVPTEVLLHYVQQHFENLNLTNLIDKATNLLKLHYADLLEYLHVNEKMDMEQKLTEEMRDLLRYKSNVSKKFKKVG